MPYTAQDLGCNARVTVYADGTVDNAICCSRNIYTQPGFEPIEDTAISRLPWLQYCAACHGHVPYQLRTRNTQRTADSVRSAEPSEQKKAESLKRSRRRAIEAVYEYIRNNTDLDCFVTLTLATERSNVDKLAARLKNYLGKQVQRHGLKYIAVYEYHHDGQALHVHMLCNRDALDLVRATSARTGKPLSHKDKHGHWHAIYNVKNWNYGYSTAIKVYGNRVAIARYVTKYVTKSEQKIRGRWYMHSHNIQRPVHRYYQVCYNDVIGRIVAAPARAHLHIKYTTPEQIALHIDAERDYGTIHSTYVRESLELDRAAESGIERAAGDLDRNNQDAGQYTHSNYTRDYNTKTIAN